MKTSVDIFAKAVSIVFYPLFMPTIGMVLLCYAYHQVMELNSAWVTINIVCTFVLTCLLPITAIMILIRKGEVTSIHIDDPKQRTMPYVYASVGFGFWSYLTTAILQAPLCINIVALGATLALFLVLIINHWWKISAHMTGMGGLLGGILSYYMYIQTFPSWGSLCIWLALTLVLMYARLWLKAHTPTQVIAGWLLGLSCTLIPNMILFYVFG